MFWLAYSFDWYGVFGGLVGVFFWLRWLKAVSFDFSLGKSTPAWKKYANAVTSVTDYYQVRMLNVNNCRRVHCEWMSIGILGGDWVVNHIPMGLAAWLLCPPFNLHLYWTDSPSSKHGSELLGLFKLGSQVQTMENSWKYNVEIMGLDFDDGP